MGGGGGGGGTCTVCNAFFQCYMVGREDNRTNNRAMLPTLKNNAAYQGSVKIELLKGAGLLQMGLSPFCVLLHLDLSQYPSQLSVSCPIIL